MPLFAQNKTTVARQLMPRVKLPPAPAAGKLGLRFNVTSELRGLPSYAALEAQVQAGQVQFHWVGDVDYETPGLTLVTEPKVDPEGPVAPGPDLVFGTEDDVYPVLSKLLTFDEPDFETGHDRAIEVFASAPYKFRILQVLCTITRGSPEAQMYLCCHPGGAHEPHSDKFDASSPGMHNETSTLHDRIIEEGEDVFAYCSTDYVLGRLTMMYQRIAE
jgi:hypothetical protein